MIALLVLTASAATLTVPGQHPQLQDAIDAASDGDTIVITGSQVGPFIIDKSLILQGEGRLQAGGSGATLSITGGTVEVSELTFSCGLGAIDHTGGDLVLDGIKLSCSGTTAALISTGRTLTVSNVSVVGNFGGSLIDSTADTDVQGLDISGGSWTGPAMIVGRGASLIVSDVRVHDAEMKGGLIDAQGVDTVCLTRIESACNTTEAATLVIDATSSFLSAIRIWKGTTSADVPAVSLEGRSTVEYTSLIVDGGAGFLVAGSEASFQGVAVSGVSIAIKVGNPLVLAINHSVLGAPVEGQSYSSDSVVEGAPEWWTLLDGGSCDGDNIAPMPGGNLHRTSVIGDDGVRSDIGATGGEFGFDAGGAEDLEDGDGVLSGEDCDDSDPLTYPGAAEDLSETDRDCNGYSASSDAMRPNGCATITGPWWAVFLIVPLFRRETRR